MGKRGRPRKIEKQDIMKPEKAVDYSQTIKPKGGMTHSLSSKEEVWGGKCPPYPRSQLNNSKQKVRGGMALIKD